MDRIKLSLDKDQCNFIVSSAVNHPCGEQIFNCDETGLNYKMLLQKL
jgi:hypothetical protein